MKFVFLHCILYNDLGEFMKKVKRKVNRKRIIIVVLIPLICIALLIANFTSIRLSIKGYHKEDKKVVLKLEKDDIKDILDYDQIIDISKWNKVKNDSHYLLYDKYYRASKESVKKVVYYIDSYYERMEDLNYLGYTTDVLFNNSDIYTISNLDTLISASVPYKKAKKYLAIKGAQIKDIKEYVDSGLKPLKAVLTVSYPGIDSSKRGDRTYTIEDPANMLVLIKNGFSVPSDYVPSDLRDVNIPYESEVGQLRDEAATALENMYKDGLKKGYSIAIKSSYRSYETQLAVYNEYFAMYDAAYAASLVSTPGSSEHQCGLSVDLTSQSVLDGEYGTFGESPDYDWVEENAYKYGFILRFPENAGDRTGATNEPWHFRYVGKEAAKEIHDKGWILEDYIEHHGFAYNLRLN